ncbi:hypothetical protein ADL07_33785 [Streptomyces sp. NRRL F-4707]|nr:hypothetical protein ADL07_33785 [Streptomyces sp. NRRL F-4707]KOX43199.1 hypothetical protein ADL09_28535 [Streptomyces sp. NRRL F-7442]
MSCGEASRSAIVSAAARPLSRRFMRSDPSTTVRVWAGAAVDIADLLVLVRVPRRGGSTEPDSVSTPGR